MGAEAAKGWVVAVHYHVDGCLKSGLADLRRSHLNWRFRSTAAVQLVFCCCGAARRTGSLSVVKSRMFGSGSPGSLVLSEVRDNPAS